MIWVEESGPVSSSGPTTSADRLTRCISIDLEVRKKSNRIHAFAGVRSDTGECVTYSDAGRNSEPTLEELDELAEGAEFVLGHNPDRIRPAPSASRTSLAADTATTRNRHAVAPHLQTARTAQQKDAALPPSVGFFLWLDVHLRGKTS